MLPVELSNNRIKELVKLHQKKYRDETGLFIVEGLKAVQELIEEKIEIIDIFATKEFSINHKYSIIKENVMKKLTTTTSPCEILAIAKQELVDFLADKNIAKVIHVPGKIFNIVAK